MSSEEIINLNKKALYLSLKSSNMFGKFFYKSILNNAVIMEIYSHGNNHGISYEQLCTNIPKSLGSRSSIQNLLNEGLDNNIFQKIESDTDKRIKKYFISEKFSQNLVDWIQDQKKIFNS